MSKNILLSICIPTYNRATYLNEAIESIISQINNSNIDKIELCISDNNSTDNTDEIINKWKEKSFIKIVYNKNNINLGADKNYLKVIEISNGEYCWFLGSDDKIAPGAIDFVIDLLSNEKCDIYISNRKECDVNMNILKDRSFFIKQNLLWNISETKILEKYFNNVNCLGGVFSYLSSIIFKRNIWIIDDKVEDFIGTAYVHVYILLGALIRRSTIKHINRSLVLCRLGNDSFMSEGFIKRLLLDYEGYYKLAEYYFHYDQILFKSFYKILKREHKFLTLIIIHYYSDIKYFKKYLIICGWNEFKIKMAYYLKFLYHFYKIVKKSLMDIKNKISISI